MKFSLLYQTTVLNIQVKQNDIGLCNVSFIDEPIEVFINLVNDSGKFTEIGWYKRLISKIKLLLLRTAAIIFPNILQNYF